jgi:hypothetical protein
MRLRPPLPITTSTQEVANVTTATTDTSVIELDAAVAAASTLTPTALAQAAAATQDLLGDAADWSIPATRDNVDPSLAAENTPGATT